MEGNRFFFRISENRVNKIKNFKYGSRSVNAETNIIERTINCLNNGEIKPQILYIYNKVNNKNTMKQ